MKTQNGNFFLFSSNRMFSRVKIYVQVEDSLCLSMYHIRYEKIFYVMIKKTIKILISAK